MKLIVEFLGTPSEEEIANIPSLKTQRYIRKIPKKKPVRFESYFKGASSSALDLLKKMLVFDPKKRISIQGALEHSFLENFHLEEDEVLNFLKLKHIEFSNLS
jgi:serine/threonine protein kinase